MGIKEITKELQNTNPVAFVIIQEEEDHYTSSVYGRICPCEVLDILKGMVEEMDKNQNDHGLPF